MPASRFAAPAEPLLEMDDIQGIAVPGFFKPRQTLLYLRIPDGSLAGFRRFVADLPVSTAARALADRQDYRAQKKKAARDGQPMRRQDPPVLVAIAFTFQGLARLLPDAREMRSVAFKQGLVARSALLGDPVDPADPGHPDQWLVGGTGQEIDAMIVVADDLPGKVDPAADRFADALRGLGIEVVSERGGQQGQRGREHFGFVDGISQPGIRGIASDDKPGDFVTPRYIRASAQPQASLQGYPGQDLVWPGEFVVGYAGSGPDPMLPGPKSDAGVAWAHNGSFLVYRRLRQNVHAFWDTMTVEAGRLRRNKAFGSAMTARRLASLLIGRWPDGTPVMRSPSGPVVKLGSDAMGNNDFLYGANSPAGLPLKKPCARAYPVAQADPLGEVCPLAAHVRKVNPRDTATDMGGAADTLARRILRVGVPYGSFVKPADRLKPETDAPGEDRGLLFMSIQSSIENQFEFLQARWMNNESQRDTLTSHDMVAGQNMTGHGGERSCTLLGKGLVRKDIQSARPFVVPTGGGYFFVPSIATLKLIGTP